MPQPSSLSVTVEVHPGQRLSLPSSVVESVTPGHWLITISPLTADSPPPQVRDHSAFLKGYAPEDEGLYDDFASR